jgi:hypothetical protein
LEERRRKIRFDGILNIEELVAAVVAGVMIVCRDANFTEFGTFFSLITLKDMQTVIIYMEACDYVVDSDFFDLRLV